MRGDLEPLIESINQPEKASGDAIAHLNAIESAITKAQKMQAELHIKPTPVPKNELLLSLLKNIPLVTGLLGDANSTTSTIGELVKVTGNAANGLANASSGMHYAGIALDIVNFIRIPVIYLAAAFLGQKPPIKLSNNAKWLYSAVLLVIAAVAIAVPVTAPFMAVTAAVISLGVGVFTLGRLLYQRHQHKKAVEELTLAIKADERDMLDIKELALTLETNLQKAVAEQDGELANQLTSDIQTLDSRYETLKEKLQQEHDARYVHQQKLKKKDLNAVMDKSVAIFLGASAVIGVVVSIFFPPIGLALLISVGIVGLGYAVGRLMTPLFSKLGNWIIGKFTHNPAITEDADKKDVVDLAPEVALAKTDAPDFEPGIPVTGVSASREPINLVSDVEPVSSTAITALMLSGKQAERDLREQIRRDEWMDRLESRLESCVNHQDATGMLMIIRDLAQRQFTQQDIHGYLDNFKSVSSTWTKGLELLRVAIDKVASKELILSPEDASQLLSSDALNAVLFDNNIDLRKLTPQPAVTEVPQASAALIVNQEDDDEGEKEGEVGKPVIS